MNIHISNLHTQLKNEDLSNLFAKHGEVQSAEIAIDAFTDQPRGFGYVEMPQDEQAHAAILALDKTELSGQVIRVQQAEAKPSHKGSYKVGNGTVNVFRFKK